eukprot:scaffold24999_cov63-Phaeocystis_antarctica.AAC.3
MPEPVVVPLTRALLRTARRYDRNPAMRVLLATSRQIGYDMIKADWVPNPAPPPTKPMDIAAKVAGDAISSVCAGARLYSDGTEGPTVQSALSSAIREALVASPPYEPAALADAAFGLLRRLDAGVALGERVLGPSPSPPPVRLGLFPRAPASAPKPKAQHQKPSSEPPPRLPGGVACDVAPRRGAAARRGRPAGLAPPAAARRGATALDPR